MFSSNTSQVSNDAVFVEDVFSTYLYTGNGSTQTITNGIDLAGKGGIVWTKPRTANPASSDNVIHQANGTSLVTNGTGAAYTDGDFGAFLSNGFSVLGFDTYNASGTSFASWTFRKQPKFFDVVTYTGNGVAGRQIAHSLGSVPGCIIVKRTDAAYGWGVYHRGANTSNPENYLLFLNQTAAASSNTAWNNTPPSSTTFTVGSGDVNNVNGGTYVAYLFAHDAGGFGLTGTDNVISCGSFTTDVNGIATASLGYEPQWILFKRTDGAASWFIEDNMRGMPTAGQPVSYLIPNNANAEGSTTGYVTPTATGFAFDGGSFGISNATYIYIAIRRGPMKVPTDGTSVFAPVATTASAQNVNAGFPVDAAWLGFRTFAYGADFYDRLRGITNGSTAPELYPYSTAAEYAGGNISGAYQTGIVQPNFGSGNQVWWMLGRAPGFFDEVCYTGNDVAGRTINHNLTVTPELIICKARTTGGSSDSWNVQIPGTGTYNTWAQLNTNATPGTVGASFLFSTSNSTTLTVSSTVGYVNSVGVNYVAYLFASCPGVSKVGSYTGTGTTQQINCGFTSGARFVLIKRTDSTGNWYVWDSARGIVAGNDPYLLLNSTAAEVTNTDYVDTYSAGFEISSTAPAAINASGGTFIFLAIA